MPEVDLGDNVLYSADKCHAYQIDRNGNYCFKFKAKYSNGEIKDVKDVELPKYIAMVKSTPHMSGTLIPDRPREMWDAIVTGVNEDGTLNLDIKDPNGFATHHCNNVPFDPTKKKPHSWHLKEI